ncbi:MBL fold metallo-hydrolase [Promethearchaeum syntrophicum]|uniref:MBL fold metallo-hydrolase n=1 Tax=Promethearchaeum syntrophicum TaxID=2594042 RepID=A0A5B9D7Y1_9ARCH|nr:MBL fold metallo-hydrolase [Candidatus Prometheoarchaeum syntrophicum]QEE15141.1 Hydroxyacylglutathione hydrolase [Candidatus Prometheoarchaeum syntrophicum]
MGTRIIPYNNGEILEWRWWAESKLISFQLFASCFLIDGLLIDSNAPGSEMDLQKYVKKLGGKNHISSCFLTHFHEDHAGGSPMLKKEFDIPIYASPLTVPYLSKGYKYRFYRKTYWGRHGQKPIDVEPVDGPIITKSGKYSFELFPMPGHSPDLTAIIDKKNQIAFVGDAIMHKYGYTFGGSSPDLYEDISQIYNSQKSLYKITDGMDDLKIYVAHVGEVNRDFIAEKIKEIENLHKNAHKFQKELINNGYKKQSKILKEIVKKMWRKGELLQFKILSMGEISRTNLVATLLKWPLDN